MGFFVAIVFLLQPFTTYARPVEETGRLPKFEALPDPVFDAVPGLFGAANQSTTYFGGTRWAADSLRWEAIEDSIWTFDSGVGSHFDFSAPHVNPYKYGAQGEPNPLHASMEGWMGIDNTYSEIPYFRRVSSAQIPCVIHGNYSFWAGVLAAEADSLCYAGGAGYGSSWFVCIGRTFTYSGSGTVTLAYDYANDTESGWDYSFVYVDTTTNGTDVEVAVRTGAVSARATHVLAPGSTMRSDAGEYMVKFCVSSDGAYSDEDGLYPTTCGALAVDDIAVTGGGVSYSTDFETDNGGWTLLPAAAGRGGDWSNIVSAGDLPSPIVPCDCDFMKDGKDTVLVFEDLTVPGHGIYQDNVAVSPWIDLRAAGRVGAPQKFVRYDAYYNLPLLNYVFLTVAVQWYPEVCEATGKLVTSPFTSDYVQYYWYMTIGCRQYVEGADSAVYLSLASVIAADAEQVRLALGVLNYCRYYANCTGISNSTPWFDNVTFGVAGTPGAPVVSARTIDTPQDAFPEDGTLGISSPARLDCNNIKGFSVPEPFSSTGDTLTIGGASGSAEVRVQFAVRPGPGIDTARYNAWLAKHFPEGAWRGLDWYSARMDTAEQGGSTTANRWMTAYHEWDPNFTGKDTDRDPTDLDPHGAMTRLKNDIFPDDLFTPGTRVEIFYKSRYLAGGAWYFAPDTVGGNFFEYEVLPSSMDADGLFNCTLYVDHATDRGSRPWIEAGMASVLTGGSDNFENRAWDRYDVQAPSSQQASFGRPAGTEYGATALQAQGYRTIVWNSAALNAFNLVEEDANVLIPWLEFNEPGAPIGNLYLSGDGIAESMTLEATSEPNALRLLNEFCGVSFTCATLRDPACPVSSGVQDTSRCIPLDPVVGARVADTLPGGRALQHLAQGNGCPHLRSFDVLDVYPGAPGAPAGDEVYNAPVKGVISYASVTNESSNYRTVVDGVSTHYRRDPSRCVYATHRTPEPALAERFTEVLTWFGDTGSPAPCFDVSTAVGIPDIAGPPPMVTRLVSLAPNPLSAGATGTIRFTMAREGRATVEVFDVAGRRVRTVFEGVAGAGMNEATWTGVDQAGRAVAGGVYFCRLKADGEEFAKRLVVVRGR
jgi:hypothetical protein